MKIVKRIFYLLLIIIALISPYVFGDELTEEELKAVTAQEITDAYKDYDANMFINAYSSTILFNKTEVFEILKEWYNTLNNTDSKSVKMEEIMVGIEELDRLSYGRILGKISRL